MNILTKLALCMVLFATGSVSAQNDSASAQITTYLVVYRPGPGWVAGKTLAEQPLKEHFKYMLSLHVSGHLKKAGPFLDDTGGALVFEAASESEAKAIIAKDPAVVNRIFLAELHPWRPVDWDQYVRK